MASRLGGLHSGLPKRIRALSSLNRIQVAHSRQKHPWTSFENRSRPYQLLAVNGKREEIHQCIIFVIWAIEWERSPGNPQCPRRESPGKDHLLLPHPWSELGHVKILIWLSRLWPRSQKRLSYPESRPLHQYEYLGPRAGN